MTKKMMALIILINSLPYCLAAQQTTLKVGDKTPAINAYRWIKGKPVNNFEKGKVYVIEFGSTWCKPCAAMIPHLSSIAKDDSLNVEVISIFVMELNTEKEIAGEAKYVQGVRDYVKKQGNQILYTVAVDDPQQTVQQNWLKAAGRAGIPVTFIIDKNGMIAWIGNDPQNLQRIVKHVSSNEYNIADYIKANQEYLATIPPFDENKLLLINGNGGNDSDFLYRSVLTKYRGGIASTPHQYINNWRFAIPGTKYAHLSIYQGRVQEVGASLAYLYYMAYGDTLWNTVPSRNAVTMLYPDTVKEPHHRKSYGRYWYRSLIEVKDKGPFLTSHNSIDNKYNYSLKVPLSKGSSKEMQEAMQRDLKTYFGYNASVETRPMPCWKLIRSDSSINILARTVNSKYESMTLEDSTYFVKNKDMRDFIFQMAWLFSPGYYDGPMMDEAPFIDFTGIKEEISYLMTAKEQRAIMMRDWDAINRFYAKLGMKWVKENIPMKVVVIRD